MKFSKRCYSSSIALVLIAAFFACEQAQADRRQSRASRQANETADAAMYQPVNYVNKDTPGPVVVVLPGEIKSANATYVQKVTENNIADFAELELSMANFQVLERSDLGPLLDELRLAVNMGDAESAQKFKKGKFETTQWFIEFDILKVEQVAEANRGFNGRALGNVLSFGFRGRGGGVASATVGSVDTSTDVGIWLVGMRYKIIDATTTRQVATGYRELKMELGTKSTSVLGIESGNSSLLGLDTMTQRLVQESVSEIDLSHK